MTRHAKPASLPDDDIETLSAVLPAGATHALLKAVHAGIPAELSIQADSDKVEDWSDR
ncbi:hypothetical protein WGT02_33525 (plasmid) [Rhizobium sp. T1470]|uniref:hypothetical protein n=1 Tax=unclassified Rhizobium TaxID=2613769 RepID=UPI001AAE6146|nr:hypothetical protein [Rhizobium sp. T1473]MCA0806290.1 hypothetical protein [Rhizobium sp. T1473]